MSAKATYEAEIVRAVRAVASLQRQRRKLRKELRRVEAELKSEKRTLKAIVQASEGRRPDVVPSRLFGGDVGFHTKKDAS